MDFDVQDVEFLRHGDHLLLAHLYVPRGPGPFRSVVDLHGGVWTLNDRTHTEPVHIAMAQAGVAVAALDFRLGAHCAYRRSVADAQYGIQGQWRRAEEPRRPPGRLRAVERRPHCGIDRHRPA